MNIIFLSKKLIINSLVLEEIPRKRHLSLDEFKKISQEISEKIGPVKSDSKDFLREMRDQR